MSMASMCDSKAATYRLPIGHDSYGGTLQALIETLAPRQKNLPCSYQESGASTKNFYGQRNTVVSPTIYFLQDPMVEVNDVIVVVNVITGEVIRCNVEGQAQPLARGQMWTVSVTRIRQPS